MAILPIVERELRVAARRPGTYWTRCCAASTVTLLWLVLLLGSLGPSPAQLGHHLLNALGILALGACMLAGVFLTSDSLSEEKREGTLGLLFLTDLKSYDVVLGKMAAASIHACLGLLALLPILGLPLMMGGVSGAEFWRMILVLLITLFFSLALGMFVSSASHEAKHAISSAFLLMLLLAGVLPAVWWLQSVLFKTPLLDPLLFPSPGFAFLKAFDANYQTRSGSSEFWSSLATIGTLGIGCVAGATIILPRSWSDGKAFTLKRKLPLSNRLSAGSKSPHPAVPLVGNPYHWLAARDKSASKIARVLFRCVIPLWLLFLAASLISSKPVPGFVVCICITFGLHLTLKVLIASEATRRVCEDGQSGALELILVTPLPVGAIVDGHRAALKDLFEAPAAVLVSINIVMTVAVVVFGKQLDMHGDDAAIFCELFLGGILMLALDFRALSSAGMWNGLNNQRHHRAVLKTIGKVLAIPWAALFFLIFLERGFRSPVQAAFTFAIWFGVGAIVDTTARSSSRRRLEKEFRSAASRRHG